VAKGKRLNEQIKDFFLIYDLMLFYPAGSRPSKVSIAVKFFPRLSPIVHEHVFRAHCFLNKK
jgi:hypothetical protein